MSKRKRDISWDFIWAAIVLVGASLFVVGGIYIVVHFIIKYW